MVGWGAIFSLISGCVRGCVCVGPGGRRASTRTRDSNTQPPDPIYTTRPRTRTHRKSSASERLRQTIKRDQHSKTQRLVGGGGLPPLALGCAPAGARQARRQDIAPKTDATHPETTDGREQGPPQRDTRPQRQTRASKPRKRASRANGPKTSVWPRRGACSELKTARAVGEGGGQYIILDCIVLY